VKLNSLERCKTLLGTFVEIELKGAVDDDELITLSNSIFDEIERVHNLFSFHSDLSEISLLNRKALDLAKRAEADNTPLALSVSDDLSKVLTFALELNQFTRGLFDITIAPSLILNEQLPNHLALEFVDKNCTLKLGNSSHITCKNGEVTITQPLCIDLGGIAKGYAVDCALAKVPEYIFCRINAGGDLAINHWQNQAVAIKYKKRSSAIKTVKMQNRALATSGNYHLKKKSAFVNPLTGKHIRFKGSMSVFSSRVMLSDALTKAMILSSRAQRRQMASYYNAQAIRINRLGFIKLYY